MGLHGNIQLGRHVGKRQFMAPGGPVFALTSYASAGDSWRKTTRLRKSYAGQAGHGESQPTFKRSWIKGVFLFNWLNLD
jgi:hypothetical protein